MKKHHSSKIFWKIPAALLMVLAGSSIAAPSQPTIKSGKLSDGMSVTITGSGFGTKSTAQPLVWDTFESGAIGTKILENAATIGKWDQGYGYDVWSYSNTIKHAGAKSAKASADTNIYNLSLSKNGSFPTVYMDFWLYIHYYDNKTRNWKPWRLYGDNDQMQINAVSLCGSPFYISVSNPNTNTLDWQGVGYDNNNWYHFQVLFQESSPNTANGILKQYINGILANNRTGIPTRSNNAHVDQIRVGHYWTTDTVPECPQGNTGADIYIDNIYLDTSWARVELTNNSNYEAATQREIQVPTAWSDGQITFTVNQGTFTSGAPVYLFIHDPSGNVSPALEVTINQGSSSQSLGIPQNLKINN